MLRAYDQEGRQISNYSVNRDHAREKQLEQSIVDIYHDAPEIRPHKSIAAPLSVYYVNCDVDSPTPVSPVASAEAPVKPATPKPAALPHATVEFLSNSAGADIYLDGNYIRQNSIHRRRRERRTRSAHAQAGFQYMAAETSGWCRPPASNRLSGAKSSSSSIKSTK